MFLYENKKVVVIGGGYGFGWMLVVFKVFGFNVIGIVIIIDNGGLIGCICYC